MSLSPGGLSTIGTQTFAEPGRLAIIVVGFLLAATAIIFSPPEWAIAITFTAIGGFSAWRGWYALSAKRGLYSPKDAAKRIGLPAVGMAQRLTPQAMRDVPPDLRTPSGYVLERPESAFAGVFRHALRFAKDGQKRTIAVTSPYHSEGATTVSLCLARTMANLGKSVLIIDCDVRKRSLTKALGLEPKTGVWEAIGHAEPQKFVTMDSETHLKVLPAARPAGPFQDLFSKRGFFDLLRTMRRQYDCVILDCPAALNSVDTRVIVGGVEAVVLVVRHGHTSTAAIRSARRQLQIGGDARPAGILINKAPKSFDLKQITFAEARAR